MVFVSPQEVAVLVQTYLKREGFLSSFRQFSEGLISFFSLSLSTFCPFFFFQHSPEAKPLLKEVNISGKPVKSLRMILQEFAELSEKRNLEKSFVKQYPMIPSNTASVLFRLLSDYESTLSVSFISPFFPFFFFSLIGFDFSFSLFKDTGSQHLKQ